MDILFVIGRVLFGGFFVIFGASYLKNIVRLSSVLAARRMPLPKIALILASLVSACGGIGVMLGFHTNYALAAIITALVFSSFALHDYWNASDPAEISVEMAQFMKNMALIGAALMMYSVLAPWNYSL